MSDILVVDSHLIVEFSEGPPGTEAYKYCSGSYSFMTHLMVTFTDGEIDRVDGPGHGEIMLQVEKLVGEFEHGTHMEVFLPKLSVIKTQKTYDPGDEPQCNHSVIYLAPVAADLAASHHASVQVQYPRLNVTHTAWLLED